MTSSGDALTACGFDVRVPALKRKKAVASLRLTSEADETVVGAQQLADVRWSAVFDDVELTASDIAQLAREARPLVKSRGQWVEIDKADLAEAAAALAERADQTKLTGADMLRHALGLEGSSPTVVSASSVAAGLPICCEASSRSPRSRRPRPPGSPASFGATRPMRSPGSPSSMKLASADAWPSTWGSGRRRPRSPALPSA